MRVGIDYRLLASRENLVNRGIGRYTQQQLRHVLRLDTTNEYLLLCPTAADLSLVLPDIRSALNVTVHHEPASAVPMEDPYDRRGLLRRAEAYQDWIHGLGVDLYHATAPFVLEQTAPPVFDACPMVATVYDLIPLIFPAEYLRDGRHRAAYAASARLVRSATRLLAISDGTRADAEKYLGFPRRAIDCAWPFADACFRPMSEDEVTRILRPTAGRVELPSRFVLTVAAIHHTKNLELLFAAYARLSARFRRSLPLVVSCHLHETGMAHVRRWAQEFGVADDVVLTGYVPDDVLAALYNRATLVVHPSRYEGFGLPVVEAMQCGAPVIATTAPSVPEIAGGAAELVDPDDPTGLAASIDGLSRDADRRARMGELGRMRARAFSPEALAANTLACYRAAMTSGPSARSRLRVAVCGPLSSAGGEAAAHSLDLFQALSASVDVEVFTENDDGVLPDDLLDRVPVHHANALARCHEREPFDAVVGNFDGPGPATPISPVTVSVIHSEVDRDGAQAAHPGATVVVAPLGTADPHGGQPQLRALLARRTLGMAADRFVALVVHDGATASIRERLAGALAGRVDVRSLDVSRVHAGNDELLACDVVVDLGSMPRRSLLARAAAAGRPVIRFGAPGRGPWPPVFCDVLAPPGATVESLVSRVRAMADDPELLGRRAAAARTWFERYGALAGSVSFYRSAIGRADEDGPVPPHPAGNKLCEEEDLGNAALAEVLHRHGCRLPDGLPLTVDDWAKAMFLRAVDDLGMIGPARRILAAGAGAASAGLLLTSNVGEVTVVVPWLGGIETPFTRALVVDPRLVAVAPIDAARLVVRPTSGVSLPLPASSVDAVMAHAGADELTEDGMARVLGEAARVVAPSGVVVLVGRVQLCGTGGRGPIPDWVAGRLCEVGLRPVVPIVDRVSEATMAARRRFSHAFGPLGDGDSEADPPLVIRNGALLGLLHLTLRKE